MPKRLDFHEGSHFEIMGIPVCVAVARGKRVTLVVGTADELGFISDATVVMRVAARIRDAIDKIGPVDNDCATGLEQSGSSPGS